MLINCVGYSLLVAAALLAELASLVLVGSYVGWLGTLGLLAGGFVLGMLILTGRGAATIRQVLMSLRHARSPAPALMDGALLALAGVLLITPGFASDLIALALFLPPVRAKVRARAQGWFWARFKRVREVGFAGHGEHDAPEGIEVIDASGTETPGKRSPRGRPSLPS